MADRADPSPLVAPSSLIITEPTEIDLEAGPGEEIPCRICLETDGIHTSYLYFFFLSYNSVLGFG